MSPIFTRLHPEYLSGLELCLLSFVPLFYRTQITDHAGKDFTGCLTCRTCILLPIKITVIRTHAEGWRKGKVRKVVFVTDSANQHLYCGRILNAFTRVDVENRSTCIFGLDLILEIQRFENVIGEVYGKLCRVGIEHLHVLVSRAVPGGAD